MVFYGMFSQPQSQYPLRAPAQMRSRVLSLPYIVFQPIIPSSANPCLMWRLQCAANVLLDSNISILESSFTAILLKFIYHTTWCFGVVSHNMIFGLVLQNMVFWSSITQHCVLVWYNTTWCFGKFSISFTNSRGYSCVNEVNPTDH